MKKATTMGRTRQAMAKAKGTISILKAVGRRSSMADESESSEITGDFS